MPEFTVSIKEKIPMDLLITSISICKGCLKTRRNCLLYTSDAADEL